MNLFQELRERRVPQITSGYIVGSWGLVQFLTFLESRMAVSPNLVNLVGLALLLLLPSVIILVWVHGRPGKDTWGRTPKVVVAANLLAVVLLLGFKFNGRDLGAVTQTIAVEDENGAVTERVVPKQEFRRRILIFYPESEGPAEDLWAREVMAYLLMLDLNQDEFLDAVVPMFMVRAFQEAGSGDGHGVPRSLQRKIARDAHFGYFLTGSVDRQDGQWRLATELHECKSAKIVARRSNDSEDLYTLTDLVSRQLREDLGIPAAHLDASSDLPIAEHTSTDMQAVAGHVQGVLAVTQRNDWEGAVPYLEDAVERDPRFALAQFLLFAVHQTLGNTEGAATAIAAAMENLYRVPERLAFIIKAQYYFSQKQDADKAIAVARMWSQIYPNDVGAYDLLATFSFVRQDLTGTIAAYEQILRIDPSDVRYLERLADLHTQLGNLEEAEAYLKRYVERFPGRADGYEDLADFYNNTGRLEEARETLARAQLIEPDDLDLALSMIELDVKFGRFTESERALADLLASTTSTRDSVQICSWQVNLASLQGRADLVIDRLEARHAADLSLQNPMQANLVYSMMVPVVSMAGRPVEALALLAEVKSHITAPYAELVGIAEAWSYADLGQVAEARATLAEGVAVVETFKLETVRPMIAMVEGMIAEAEGDLEAAIADYRVARSSAIRVQPVHHLLLARALRLAGEDKEAMAVLEEGLKIDPMHPEFHLEIAHLQHARGDVAKANEHLDIALAAWTEADPEYPPAREARQLAELLEVS